MEELELTYLIKEIPEDLRSCPSRKVVDRYIPEESEHPSLRLRKSGDKSELTKKEPIDEGDISRQLEQTIVLTEKEYEYISKIPAKVVAKTRFYYPYEEKTLEVDVFEGDLDGLILVDAEFSDPRDKENFSMPSFCLAEVTQEKAIAGGLLAGKKLADIQDLLDKFGYQPLSM